MFLFFQSHTVLLVFLRNLAEMRAETWIISWSDLPKPGRILYFLVRDGLFVRNKSRVLSCLVDVRICCSWNVLPICRMALSFISFLYLLLPGGRLTGFQFMSGRLKSPAVHMTAILNFSQVFSISEHSLSKLSRLTYCNFFYIISRLSLCMCLCMCLCVCYTRTHAQTAEPIVSKFCMSIEGHLAGNIGYVSCAWVHGGLRERRRKGGGVSFWRQRIGDRERL